MRTSRKKEGMRPELHGNWYRLQVPGVVVDEQGRPILDEDGQETTDWIYRKTHVHKSVEKDQNGRTPADVIADKVMEIRKMGTPNARKLLQRVFEGKLELPDMMVLLDQQDKAVVAEGKLVKLAASEIVDRALDSLTMLPLAKLVDTFDAKMSQKREDRKMVGRLRHLFPPDCPHRLDWFTAANLEDLLNNLTPQRASVGQLKVTGKQGYRRALSKFARMLMSERPPLLGSNPTYGKNITIARTEVDADIGQILHYLEAEVRRIVEALADNPVVQVMVCIAFSTSAEFEAICRMRWESLRDWKKRRLHVPGTKRTSRTDPTVHRNRVCFVSIPWCWEIIERYFREHIKPGDYVVPRSKLGHKHNVVDGPNTQEHHIRRALRAACEQEGLRYLAFHHFRHSFAVHWIQAGALIGRVPGIDEAWLQSQLGHKPGSLELRRVYGKFINDARHLSQSDVLLAAQAQQEAPDDLAARRARGTGPARRPMVKIRRPKSG